MQGLAVLLNELAIGLTRKYIPLRARLRILASYYRILCLPRWQKRSAGGTIRFLGYSIYARSITNALTILREVFVFGDYYFKASNETPIIIDCGGNIGVSTLFFKWIYPKARIVVFEPSAANATALRRNIEHNRLEDVTLIERAAAREDGKRTFWESTTRPGSSTVISEVHATKALSKKHRFVETEVHTERLSKYIGEHVDLLKIDIEGAEGEVIQELADAGALERIKTIILEYHDNKHNTENKLTRLLTILEEHGFSSLVYTNDVGPSSEELIRQSARHFLIRADRSGLS